MGENGHGESTILAVTRNDRWREMLGRGATGGRGEPLLGGLDGVYVLLGCTGHGVQGSPAQCGGGNVTEALGGVAPATVGVCMISEPLEAALNIGGVIITSGGLNVLQRGDSDGSGERTTGEFTLPMAVGIAFGKQCRTRGGQCGIESGGVEAHWSGPSAGLRFC